MKDDYIVKKSNHFIMNSNYDMSMEEQRIIMTLASMVQPDDKDFKPYVFKIADFVKLLGIEDKKKYTKIPKLTKRLMEKVLEIQEDDELLQVAWLCSARHNKGSGQVTLMFAPDLKPYMLHLNTLFTQYKLSNILSMKSKYSPRIYEFLKCNEFKKQGYIEIPIEQLRKQLRADEIYPRYNDFKRFIILHTQKELKKLTDISFEFEEIKTGRKVTSIRFYIRKNILQKQTVHPILPEPVKKDVEFEQQDMFGEVSATSDNIGKQLHETIEKIFFAKIPFEETDRLIQEHGYERLEQFKNDLPKLLYGQKDGVNNVIGWYKSMVGRDYTLPQIYKNTPKTKYHQMAERHYDKDFYESLYSDLDSLAD